MANRRAFLASVGAGITSLGLPGLAQAFGRRRRCTPCPPPCETQVICPTATVPPPPPPNPKLCPQTRGQYNGIWYYGALNCATTPPSSANFTSSQYLDPVPAPCSSGCPPCVNSGYSPIISGGSIARSQHVHGSPCLTKLLDPSKDHFTLAPDLVGDWYIKVDAYPCKLKLSDPMPRDILLMKLLCFPVSPGPGEPTSYLLYVGQEFVGPGGTDVKTPTGPPDPSAPWVYQVKHLSDLYDVVLLKPKGP